MTHRERVMLTKKPGRDHLVPEVEQDDPGLFLKGWFRLVLPEKFGQPHGLPVDITGRSNLIRSNVMRQIVISALIFSNNLEPIPLTSMISSIFLNG